jgi:hypothetical protein
MQRRAISLFSVLCLFLLGATTALRAQTPPPIPAGHVRIHYFRPDGNYLGWTVYAFGDTTEDTANFNGGPVQVTGRDAFGAYFDVGVTSTAQNVGIIIHNGNTKDPGPNEFINPATQATNTGSSPAATFCAPRSRRPSSKPIPRFRLARRASIIFDRTQSMPRGRSTHSETRPKTRAILGADPFLWPATIRTGRFTTLGSRQIRMI